MALYLARRESRDRTFRRVGIEFGLLDLLRDTTVEINTRHAELLAPVFPLRKSKG
jgi:hypothetical protein